MNQNKWVLLVSLFIIPVSTRVVAGDPDSVSHPRLLLTQSEFDDWQTRHSEFPWNLFSNTWWDRTATWAKQLDTKLNGNILGYVLDYNKASPSRSDYVREIIEGIDFLYETEFSYSTDHDEYTKDAACTVHAIFAFDLIYDAPELSASDRNRAYTRLSEIVAWYKDNFTQRGWRLCPYGLFSVWALFEGDPTEIATEVNRYKAYLQETLQFPDGTWIASPRYFSARIGGRFAKTAPIDVITKTGTHDFYNDPQMHGFMDWACAFWRTPFGAEQLFGDGTSYSQGISAVSTRFGNYSDKHGRMAKWYINNFTSRGFIDTGYGTPFAFIYGTTSLDFADLEPLMPTSLLMDNYGATLWGRNGNTEALMGTVHSFGNAIPGQDFGHSHQDTCSIHIAGYGVHLLFNSGGTYYSGWRECRHAWLQNSVLIGSRTTHDYMYGNGLTDGLTGGVIEFGRTDSGNALGNGRHYRNLYHVHEAPGKNNGYFILLDEVKPDNAGDNVKINLHPNSKIISAVSSKQEYHCPADFNTSGDSDGTEAVTVFYGTTPNQVNIPTGDRDSPGNTIDYLEAVYTAGSDGWLRAVTVLFPEDGTHVKPPMQQLAAGEFGGASIHHNSTRVDTFWASDNVDTFSHGDVSFRGTGIFYRTDHAEITSYAVTRGRLFDDGRTNQTGFSSSETISLQMDGATGHIESDGATVIFYSPLMECVKIDGDLVASTPVNGGLQVTVPAGRHAVRLVPHPSSQAFDFGTPGLPIAYGYTRVSHTTTNGAYRWTDGSNLDSRDRGAGLNNLNRDLVFGADPRTFDVEVKHGTYRVTVTLGDLNGPHDDLVIKAEGITVRSDVDRAAGQVVDEVFLTSVTDGTLSLEFSDAGGANPHWVVNGIKIDDVTIDHDLPEVSSLVAYYPFDDGSGVIAADVATNDGPQDAVQNQGAIGWDTAAPFLGAGSLVLDGSASLQAVDAIGVGANAFTISLWFNPDTTNPGYDGLYMARSENWGIAYEGADPATTHVDYRIDNDPDGGSSGRDSPAGGIHAGQWHHAALTWTTDGTSAEGRAYLDGVEVNHFNSTTSPSIARTYTGHLSTWSIGDDPCCDGREVRARIDDLAVFREFLTPQRITRIHQEGLAGRSVLNAFVPVSFTITSITLDPGTGDMTIVWDSSDGAPAYDVLTTTNLALPVEQWNMVSARIPSVGATTTYTHPGAALTNSPRFYVVSE